MSRTFKKGDKIHRLTFIKLIKNPKSKHICGLFKCDCNKTTITRLSSVISGHTSSCGCLQKEILLKTGVNNALPIGEAAKNKLYKHYIHGAKRRNLKFNISLSDFVKLTKSNCHYCGRAPFTISKSRAKGNYGDYIYNGLDRVDNLKGYIKSNVVPCCVTCNFMKARLGVNEFINQVEMIHEHGLKTDKI